MDILEALQRLDPKNDDHWTAAGEPAVAAVEGLLEKKITRADIERAAPGFSRGAVTDPRDLEGPKAGPGTDPRDTGAGQAGGAPPPAADPDPPSAEAGNQANGAGVHTSAHGRPELKELLAHELRDLPKDPAEARLYLEQRMAELGEDKRLLTALTAAVEAHYQKIVKVAPEPTPQERFRTDRAHYVQTQEVLRANRAERLQMLRSSNVDIKQIAAVVHPSQLDAALSRKNTRGAQRPQFFEGASPKKDAGTQGS